MSALKVGSALNFRSGLGTKEGTTTHPLSRDPTLRCVANPPRFKRVGKQHTSYFKVDGLKSEKVVGIKLIGA